MSVIDFFLGMWDVPSSAKQYEMHKQPPEPKNDAIAKDAEYFCDNSGLCYHYIDSSNSSDGMLYDDITSLSSD